MSNIKKGDKVVVTTGRDKGKKGEVLKLFPQGEPCPGRRNQCRQAPSAPDADQAGGIVNKESTIHLSNLAHVDPKSGKASRIGFKTLNDGRKVRFAKKSGEVIDV